MSMGFPPDSADRKSAGFCLWQTPADERAEQSSRTRAPALEPIEALAKMVGVGGKLDEPLRNAPCLGRCVAAPAAPALALDSRQRCLASVAPVQVGLSPFHETAVQ